MTSLLLTLVCWSPIASDRVAVTQILHVGEGRSWNHFVVWWDAVHVVDWRYDCEVNPLSPPRSKEFWFFDCKRKRLQVIRADSVREDWLGYDPEVEDGKVLPAKQRRGLSR